MAGTKRIQPAKTVSSKMETLVFNRAEAQSWELPPFQRPLRVNDKVRGLAEELKLNGGIISGIITLGKLPQDKTVWLVDGQHRREGFFISELPEALSDVRTCAFDSMADMADEFVRLQQSLVKMRPDDVLRGLEASTRSLKVIRETCPFVGYDIVRRSGSDKAPIISMALSIRHWVGSRGEAPTQSTQGSTAAQMAREMDDRELTNLCKFLHVAHAAWGRDTTYARLWSGLNLGMAMWLYRRIVLDTDRSIKRAVNLNTEQFKKCLMALSADNDYIDWLQGRSLSDHHRAPCYRRIKQLLVVRLKAEGMENPKFPAPSWAV